MTEALEVRYTKNLEDFDGDPSSFVEDCVKFIRKEAGDKKVCISLSGGVDSSTVTKLFKKAVGDKTFPLHLDTGFMREINGKDESEIIVERFRDLENMSFKDVKERFYSELFGIEDAEEKRKKFRELYADAVSEQIGLIGAEIVSQGTIAPDIEETKADLKSQNNVDVPFQVEKLVEPLAGLDKSGVRKVAKYLGFDKNVWLRMPFLGPGLLARTVGKVSKEKLEVERKANDIVERELDSYNEYPLYDEETGKRTPFQVFAATFSPGIMKESLNGLDDVYILGNKVTGVSSGKRVYKPPICLKNISLSKALDLGEKLPEKHGYSRVLLELKEGEGYPVSIRAVDSLDARTAKPLKYPEEFLKEVAIKISGIKEAGNVLYDVSPKPPATIEYE